jgi:hypothetical protein
MPNQLVGEALDREDLDLAGADAQAQTEALALGDVLVEGELAHLLVGRGGDHVDDQAVGDREDRLDAGGALHERLYDRIPAFPAQDRQVHCELLAHADVVPGVQDLVAAPGGADLLTHVVVRDAEVLERALDGTVHGDQAAGHDRALDVRAEDELRAHVVGRQHRFELGAQVLGADVAVLSQLALGVDGVLVGDAVPDEDQLDLAGDGGFESTVATECESGLEIGHGPAPSASFKRRGYGRGRFVFTLELSVL